MLRGYLGVRRISEIAPAWLNGKKPAVALLMVVTKLPLSLREHTHVEMGPGSREWAPTHVRRLRRCRGEKRCGLETRRQVRGIIPDVRWEKRGMCEGVNTNSTRSGGK